MKKLLCVAIAVLLILSSVSALAASIAPATGTSPIKAEASVSGRTVTVEYTDTAPFVPGDDVTFLFYIPESETSDNIVDDDEHIIHADQIDYDANGFSFTLSTSVEKGFYNLLIGGTDVDVPLLLKNVELKEAVKYGDVTADKHVTSADLVLLAQYLAGFDSAKKVFAEPAVKLAANVTHDLTVSGEPNITSADLVRLAQHLAGFTSASDLSIPQ